MSGACRNYIQYVQKGKVNRTECSVSGLPGCIGSERCKFFLKKRKIEVLDLVAIL